MFTQYRRIKHSAKISLETSVEKSSHSDEPVIQDLCPNYPLHAAVRCSPNVVIQLGPAATQLDQTDQDGNTPLHLAVERGYSKWVDYLLSHKADVNIVNKCGMTPLLLAVRHSHPDLVLLLLSHDANQHLVNSTGQTALHYAVCVGDKTIMNYLLQYKVKVNLQDAEGTTPLLMACKMRQTAMVQQLLQYRTVAKANPTLCDKLGRSPLHWVAEVGDVDSARALIAANADLNALDTDLETPFVRAIKKNNLPVLDVLMDAGCDRADIDGLNGTATTIAALLGRTEVMERLLDAGEDPNEFGHFGLTPLTAATFEGHVDTVKLLLDRGADPNYSSRNGSTPLIKAAVCMREAYVEARHEITRLLLRANADPNQRAALAGTYFTGYTNGRNCPLSFACTSGCLSLARMHLIAGCRITLSDIEFWEKSGYNCSSECVTIMQFLRSCSTTVHSLKFRCRQVIRAAVEQDRVHLKIGSLPLPPAIISYLQYSDLDDIQPEFYEEIRNITLHKERMSLGTAPCCLKSIQGTLAYDMFTTD